VVINDKLAEDHEQTNTNRKPAAIHMTHTEDRCRAEDIPMHSDTTSNTNTDNDYDQLQLLQNNYEQQGLNTDELTFKQ